MAQLGAILSDDGILLLLGMFDSKSVPSSSSSRNNDDDDFATRKLTEDAFDWSWSSTNFCFVANA